MATPLTKPSDLIPSNNKKAEVLKISELIEEVVTLLIDDTTVTCFTSYYPYEIKAGNFYDVELTLNLADDYAVQKICSIETLAERMDNSFSYTLYGQLNNEHFHTFTVLSAEGIHDEHPYLNGFL